MDLCGGVASWIKYSVKRSESQVRGRTKHIFLKELFMEKFFKDLLENGLNVLKRFNDFKGRTSRKEFWRFVIAAFLVGIITLGILSAIPFLGKLFAIVATLFQLATIGLSLSVGIRRLHDVNKSGKLMIPYLVGFIPLVIINFITGFVVSRVPTTVNPYSILADMDAYMASAHRLVVLNNLSGFFAVVGLVGFIILALFWFREGDPGENKYGPKPE
jgi:uncharacterized membrane protein YhaH (DUF805 family)